MKGVYWKIMLLVGMASVGCDSLPVRGGCTGGCPTGGCAGSGGTTACGCDKGGTSACGGMAAKTTGGCGTGCSNGLCGDPTRIGSAAYGLHGAIPGAGLIANGPVANGASGLAPADGKEPLRPKDLYDPCWPERYANLAHRAVNRAFTPQVVNGHVLDQTVWNQHFEEGSDRLTPGGIAHLQYVSRRRPEADRVVYLASAMDLPYDPNCPERYCGARQELDSLRVAAIQKFLVGLNCGRNQDWQVLVHDPSDVTVSATPVSGAIIQMYGRYRGGLATGAGGAGGAAGPTGSVGGFAGAGGAAGR